MGEPRTKQLTRSGDWPTHGRVQAVRDVPAFRPPGLFWGIRRLAKIGAPYLCPQCGAKVSLA